MTRILIVKLSYIALYGTFSKEVGFKKYLHGVRDEGSRLSLGLGHMG